jgi:hypothetical protein
MQVTIRVNKKDFYAVRPDKKYTIRDKDLIIQKTSETAGFISGWGLHPYHKNLPIIIPQEFT